MELKNYNEEQQRAIVNHWNYYYGKGLRSLADLEEFHQLSEERLDDLLRLMVLDAFSDFYQEFVLLLPTNFSLCNIIFILFKDNTGKNTNGLTLDKFFEMINAKFKKEDFDKNEKNIVEQALKSFESIARSTANEEQDIVGFSSKKRRKAEKTIINDTTE